MQHVEWRTGSATVLTDAGSMETARASLAKLAVALVAMAVCTVSLVIGWRAQRRPSHAPDPWKLPPRVTRSGSDASTGTSGAQPASASR